MLNCGREYMTGPRYLGKFLGNVRFICRQHRATLGNPPIPPPYAVL